MRKSIIVLLLLLFISPIIYSQNKSILICGFTAELGMSKADFMNHLNGYYSTKKIDNSNQNQESFIVYEEQKEIGMVEFDGNGKLISVHKNWGDFSLLQASDLYECLFSIFDKYKIELENCKILTQNIVEPTYKIKIILIRTPERDFHIIYQNDTFTIEEQLY